AEIRMVPFNFPPKGWAFCDGQILPLSQNTALFSLLGTTYGGDGKSTFALPNLQGSAPMQAGQGPGLSLRDLGETGGSETVTLLAVEMPAHRPNMVGGNAAPRGPDPGGTGLAQAGATAQRFYIAPPAPNPLAPEALTPAGGSQPHNNLQPYLVVNFIIALQGVFPPRS